MMLSYHQRGLPVFDQGIEDKMLNDHTYTKGKAFFLKLTTSKNGRVKSTQTRLE